jgi:hypothetical protein
MEQVKTGNINDILKLMNRANEGFAYEIFIPSLERNVMFRQINTSQQKRLIKAIIDSPAYNTEFIFALKQIIEENCIESLNVGEFTIIDKLIIALKMRAMSVGNDFKLVFKVKDEKEDNKEESITLTIDLSKLAEEAILYSKVDSLTIKDDKGIYEVLCNLPTINDEYNLEDQLRRNNTQIDIKNETELRETVGNVFINEIVKYVKKINIKDQTTNNIIEIDLKDIDFKNRINILGQIPASIIKKVIDYIANVNNNFEKVLLFKHQYKDQILEERLKIDASFFTLS